MPPKDAQKKILVLALGNPGEAYATTYHNAGMLALPVVIGAMGADPEKLAWKNHKKLFAYAAQGGAIFVKSLLFMNESGRAAAEAIKKFGIDPENLVVLQDESDLPIGDFKLSFDRSSGGHKGVQSIIDHIGSQRFWRVRIGIRPVRETVRKKAETFVLATIKPADAKILAKTATAAAADLAAKLARD